MAFRLLFSVAQLSLLYGLELTPENWDASVAGKGVFIKFLAPW